MNNLFQIIPNEYAMAKWSVLIIIDLLYIHTVLHNKICSTWKRCHPKLIMTTILLDTYTHITLKSVCFDYITTQYLFYTFSIFLNPKNQYFVHWSSNL